jgi:steroid delta-isomerase-like uncharacterized protein
MVNSTESLIKESLVAMNSHDIEKFLTFYTDDCVYEDMAIGKVNHGKEEIRAFFTTMLVQSPDVKIEEKSIFTTGNWAAGEFVLTGTNTGDTPEIPATGKSFSIRAASIFQLRDGRICRQSDYWNMASFLQQLGVIPS